MVESMKPLFILSYGGGVNSSALLFHLLDTRKPLDLMVFADTGEELPETYDAVERMKAVCKEKNIEFVTVSKGNLYDYYKARGCVMSVMKRDCTGKFKIAPIRSYLRQRYGKDATFVMYIGIAYDEWTRMKDSNVKYITHSYPFCDDKITRSGNMEILRKHGFSAIKSGCKGCIYNKRKTWLKMAIEDPAEFDRHLRLDMDNKRYPEVTLNPNYRLEDISKQAKGQMSLTSYEDIEPNCDVSGSCFL
jgi:hypothetical protein